MLDWYAIPRPPMLNDELSFAARGFIAYVLCFWDGGEIVIPAEFRPSSVTSLHPYGAALVSTNSAVPSFVRE